MTNELSTRGQRACRPSLSYLAAFFEASGRPWTTEDPGGFINLCIAENKLAPSIQAIASRLAACAPLPSSQLGYDNMCGQKRLQEAVALHLERHLLTSCKDARNGPPTEPPMEKIDPEEIVCSAGCGAIADNLFWLTLNPGDGVIIPAPFYPAFVNDLEVKCELTIIPAPEPDASVVPTPTALEAAAAAAEARGVRVRALLVTNPGNPTGVVLAESALQAVMEWGMARGLHVVVDEVYCGSVFSGGGGDGGKDGGGDGGPPFVSAAAIARSRGCAFGEEARRERLHIMWGVSKDLCASGLRLGCLWTQNKAILKGMGNLSYFCAVSNHTQCALAEILSDQAFMQSFETLNSQALRRQYTAVAAALDAAGIAFVPATAGMFVWVDARALLPPGQASGRTDGATWEAERELWEELFRGEPKVLFTPGRDCHAAAPGFFRLCYAAVDEAALTVLKERLLLFVAKRKAGGGGAV